MASEVINLTQGGIRGAYQVFLNSLPNWAQIFVNLFLIVVVITIYSILIWHFYRFIAKKNFFNINLKRYNRSTHPLFSKSIAGIFYLIEYILLLPILVFVWFSIFTLLLMFLAPSINSLATILLISATITAAIRMTAYYKEDLSKDVAKLLPFTLLGVFITQFEDFNFNILMNHVGQIPNLFSQIGIYFLFILVIELVLRLLDVIFRVTGVEEDEEPSEEE